MYKFRRRAFTLVELILVVSMVIILAVIGTSSSNKAKNKAISKEAISNLKLIAAAERIYKMESDTGVYTACSCNSTATCNNVTTGCNQLLKLNLNPTNWSYTVTLAAGAATATATNASIGTYYLCSGNFDLEPKLGSCPP